MHKYERIIYWSDEDNKYIVEVPELPGCMSDGDTIDKANANCDIVIKEWIEEAKLLGRDIPTPKGRFSFV